METFHTGSASLNSLQSVGELHDQWLRNVWNKFERSDSKAQKNLLNRDVNTINLYVFFDTKASRQRMQIAIYDGEYTLEHIKKLIWAKKCVTLSNRYRYFFRTWSKEISKEVLDETLDDNQVVLKYCNSIFVNIEDKIYCRT